MELTVVPVAYTRLNETLEVEEGVALVLLDEGRVHPSTANLEAHIPGYLIAEPLYAEKG